MAGTLTAGPSLPAIGSGTEACPAAAGKMPLVNEITQISEGGGNTVKCDYERLGKKGQFQSGVYLQLAWIENGSSAEPWADLDTWCGASQFDPDCTNSCYIYPRHGQRLLYVSWVASSPREWNPRGVVERTATELAAAFEQRAAVCPAGFAPQAHVATTIVLSGGPGVEPPAIGSSIGIPPDDRHRIVIGGPGGAVIREEHLGERATISTYGPRVTDADGNWSVLVAIDVTAAPEPVPLSSAPPSPTRAPAETPEPTPELATPVSDVTTEPATSEPTEMPPIEPPTPGPSPVSGQAASPTLIPPPELIGVPAEIAAIVAELPPAGAGAVRNVSDHVAVLGESLETEQSATIEIPPDDIGSLRELLPDLVQEVWLTDDAIVVTTTRDEPSSILVTPVIGDDGLISVELSQFQFATYHPVVRALVAALNGYVVQQGGRFTDVSVTPQGLTVTATKSGQE